MHTYIYIYTCIHTYPYIYKHIYFYYYQKITAGIVNHKNDNSNSNERKG